MHGESKEATSKGEKQARGRGLGGERGRREKVDGDGRKEKGERRKRGRQSKQSEKLSSHRIAYYTLYLCYTVTAQPLLTLQERSLDAADADADALSCPVHTSIHYCRRSVLVCRVAR